VNKKVIIRCVLASFVILFQTVASSAGQPVVLKFPEYDIVIYGGTSAGVIAAVQAARTGKTAIIVCPGKHPFGFFDIYVECNKKRDNIAGWRPVSRITHIPAIHDYFGLGSGIFVQSLTADILIHLRQELLGREALNIVADVKSLLEIISQNAVDHKKILRISLL
jgi:hypothetical protein